MQVDIQQAVEIEEDEFGSCFETADQQEGMEAFLEKRKHEPFINR
jgi:enoyl-CoA hydratase